MHCVLNFFEKVYCGAQVCRLLWDALSLPSCTRVVSWWLYGSVPDCCPAVPGSNPVSPQPTSDCQSPGGLPPGMALGCGLTSVRGNRRKNFENESLVLQKHKEKKKVCAGNTRFPDLSGGIYCRHSQSRDITLAILTILHHVIFHHFLKLLLYFYLFSFFFFLSPFSYFSF